MARMRNTTLQQSSTVIHACSNTLDDQRGKENGITNLVSLVGRLCWMKKYGTTSQDVEESAWRRAVQQLDSCLHNNNKIWQMALAKIEGTLPEEIKTIKDNLSEPLELDWDAEPIINLLDPEQFHKHYQELALTREEQEQQLEQLNARLCQHCLILCDF
ncbi:hypothetical protein G9A89_021457 [Geosiphon pyriformis]|nr:hypothetical protein G9A89_021457 [Geosiphon pyriformis]